MYNIFRFFYIENILCLIRYKNDDGPGLTAVTIEAYNSTFWAYIRYVIMCYAIISLQTNCSIIFSFRMQNTASSSLLLCEVMASCALGSIDLETQVLAI